MISAAGRLVLRLSSSPPRTMSPPPTASTEYKAERIAAFIAERAHLLPDKGARPLIVSMQGPQGAGGCRAARRPGAVAQLTAYRQEHRGGRARGAPAGGAWSELRRGVAGW